MSKDRQPVAADVDVAIAGGGIAGLWLLNRLHAEGYAALLLEADKLGNAQTLSSQGMIHGGLKYALGASLTGASEAVAAMPERWRAAMRGDDVVDLRGVEALSEHNLLFADATSIGRLTSFFASRALRGRIRRLDDAEQPAPFAGTGVSVYQLDDLVIDTGSLLTRLLTPVTQLAYQHRLEARDVTPTASGWRLALGDTVVSARQLVLAAGIGNGPLLDALQVTGPAMQRRPLQQAVVRHPRLPRLFAHCLTGIRSAEPRLTISSHREGDGWLWYIGGQLASDGAGMSSAALMEHTRRELCACLGWLDLADAEISTLRIDRAEAAAGGRRPDEAFAEAVGNLVVCWPTKLTLAPDLGDRVRALLPPPACHGGVPTLALPAARLGLAPWAR